MFHAISCFIKKKIGVKTKIRGGVKKNPGGVDFFYYFFLEKLLSHFTFYGIFNIKKNIEKFPFTYWLNGRWFLQIVERDSWNLYPLYPLFPCSDLVSQMWVWFVGGGGGGGGVMFFFSHFMLFPTFLEKKSGNTKQLFLI